MKSRFLTGGIILFAGVLLCVPAAAIVVPPGTPQFPGLPPDAFAGLAPGGSIIADTGVQNFSTTSFHGTVEAQVYKTAGGTLDFLYQFANSGTSADAVSRATAASFAGFTTDVGFNTTYNMPTFSGTVSPHSVDRPNLSGDVVGFDFNTAFPGTTSDVLEIDTNAMFYTAGTLGLIDAIPTSVAAFAPTTVPEPASLLLSATLLGAAGLLFRRKVGAKRA